MTKLKTLKDICDCSYPDPCDCYPDRIKEEVIKWVKYYRKRRSYGDEFRAVSLEQFHNITEEDLK